MKAVISDKPLVSDRTNDTQTLHLNELLGANENYFTKEFLLPLIFKLPSDIVYRGKRGYLYVGPLGIEYTSLTSEYKVNVVYMSSTLPAKDLYDCFIDTLEFFRKYQNDIQILDAPEGCVIDYIKITNDINV